MGVDPGVGGGIAMLTLDSVALLRKMPETDSDLLDLIGDWTHYGSRCVASLEFVRSSPQMGVASAFTFGSGYGRLRMALVAKSVSFEEPTPGKWQKAMGCLSKGDKSVTKRKAQELFPFVDKITNATADALLLAEYTRRLTLSRGGVVGF